MSRFDLTEIALALVFVAICAPGVIWWIIKIAELLKW